MKYTLVALAIAIVRSLAAEAASPDQQARFLAGLPVEGTPLEARSRETAWQRHASEFDSAWGNLERRQLAKIRGWTPQILGNDTLAREPLFYMFSGPDFLYADTFFPNASTYVFCGLEPVGAVPDVTKLTPDALAAALSNLRRSLNAVMSFSFFITKDMKNDLRSTQLSGTIPVLYVFMARLGNQVKTVELTGLDNNGELTADKSSTQGVKITFARPGAPDQTLYYFSTDISNPGIRNKPGFIRFCGKLGHGHSFVKAASYLMHMDEFSDVRDFLLVHSKTLVQDDSGIPFRFFAPEQWEILCIGHYPGPIEMFKNRYQRDLAAAFRSSNPPPLSFSFGYRWHPNESSVIVATSLKSVPKAIPVK